MRQLSLLHVEDAMTGLPRSYTRRNEPAIAPNADLRSALALLLRTHAPVLAVVEDGRAVGILTLEYIRCATRGRETP